MSFQKVVHSWGRFEQELWHMLQIHFGFNFGFSGIRVG